jgi:hypothetical protein
MAQEDEMSRLRKADFIIKYNSMALFVPQYRVPEKTSTPTKPKPVGDL